MSEEAKSPAAAETSKAIPEPTRTEQAMDESTVAETKSADGGEAVTSGEAVEGKSVHFFSTNT